jgi:hypothetical protein
MSKASPGATVPRTITVSVPIAFRRRGGRKTLTTPDASPATPPAHTKSGSALVKAIARAFRWRELLETRVYCTVEEIAVAERINPSYACRVLRLTLLAPDVIEAILDARQPAEVTLAVLMRPFAVEWCSQREFIRRGGASSTSNSQGAPPTATLQKQCGPRMKSRKS